MPVLLLQTFAWMVLFGLLGAILGCLARRLFAPRMAEADLATAGMTAGMAPGMTAGAAQSSTRIATPAVPPAPKRPVVEASKAPAPVTPPPPASAKPAAPASGSASPTRTADGYSYPVTTVGIPRENPAPIQPQIKQIELHAAGTTAAAATAAVTATAATVDIRQPAAAPASAASARSATNYPVSTIGIPTGYVAQPSTPTSAALAAVRGDTARFERALAGEAPQPRPEPLRPELARTPSVAATIPPAAPAAPAAPSTTAKPVLVAPAAPSPAAAKAPDEQPYVPVATGTAALTALAARAAAATGSVAPAATKAEPATPAAAAAPAPNSAASDDLMRIRSIDAAMQGRLKSAGVTRFTDMARWQPDDVARVSQSLGLVGRIEQENWIEQAQILASGGETEYSRRRARGEIPTVIPVSSTPAAAPATPASPAVPSGEGAAAAAAAAAMASAAVARAAVANVEPAMPVKLADAIREKEAKPDAAAPADANTRISRPDLAGLRSVRSEALRDVTASEQLRSGGSARPMGAMEDLKRIRGIGVLIEKKLNSLGVSSYEQIANWTNADIDRVSQILDFKGRIERESWVEQARILASGGHTEFSKRVDRGEA